MAGKEVAPRSQTEDWLSKQTGVEVTERDGKRVMSIPPSLAAQVNLLTPVSQVQQIDPNFSPAPRLIHLSPNQGDGDVYKESGSLALTAKALAKIADMAGVEHVDSIVDDMGGTGVRITVVGRKRGPDGSWRLKKATKTVRFDRLHAKIKRETLAKNASATADYIEKRIDDEMEHVDAKVETKAWNRVIRGFLAVKSTYSNQEMQRPFLAITYSFTPDYASPGAVRLMELNYGAAQSEVFGALPAASDKYGDVVDLDDGPVDDLDDHEDAVAIAEEAFTPDFNPETGEVVEGEVEVVPDKPDEDPKFTAGPYKDSSMSEVVQSPSGRRWLASSAQRLTGKKREQAVAWLSWVEGHNVSPADLMELAAEDE